MSSPSKRIDLIEAPYLMFALGQKQTCAVQNGMSALPPKADMCSATSGCPLCAKSGHTHSVVLIRRSILISAGKLHREPHGIAGKPHAGRFSGIREYCLGRTACAPRSRNSRPRRLGNAAMNSLTATHNIVGVCNASWGKFSLDLFKTLLHIVRQHWHAAALFLKLFAAS